MKREGEGKLPSAALFFSLEEEIDWHSDGYF
jgi:hypothetical protein